MVLKNYIITGGAGIFAKKMLKLLNGNVIGIDMKANHDSEFDSFYVADLTNYTELRGVFKRILEKYKVIDGLVFAHGMNSMCDFYSLELDQWDKTFEVNTKSVVMFLKMFYPIFSNEMSIVCLASQNGVVAHEFRLDYGASKAAIIQMVKNLTVDFSMDTFKDIKINCISPSYIENNQNKSYFFSNEGKQLLERNPYKRLVQYDDVCHAVEFLLSEKSAAIRGHNLIIDYGYTII